MALIGGLSEDAELFESSVRLQHVATGLKRIINGKEIEEREQENFEWAGNLMGQMDWNSKHYIQGEHLELCIIATRLRPVFYGALSKFRISFDAGFSERLYKTLTSYGREVQLGMKKLRQAHQVVQLLAENSLTELQYTHGMGQI